MKKHNNSTDLIYKGEVNISINVKGKLYSVTEHNEGTNYLKYLFAKMLYGEFNKDDVPTYIAIFKKDTSGQITLFTKKKILLGASLLVGESSEADNGLPTAIKFTGYIAYEDLLAEVAANDSDNSYYFYLYPAVGANYLASILVTAKSLSYITAGTTATVTWTMLLLNYNEY